MLAAVTLPPLVTLNMLVVPDAPPHKSNNLLAEFELVFVTATLSAVAVKPELFHVCVMFNGLLVVSLIVPSANPVMAVLFAMLTPKLVNPVMVPPVIDAALDSWVAMEPSPMAVLKSAAESQVTVLSALARKNVTALGLVESRMLTPTVVGVPSEFTKSIT